MWFLKVAKLCDNANCGEAMSLGYFTASLVHSTLFCGNLNVPQMKCFSLTIVCVDAKYGNTCIPQKAMSQTLAIKRISTGLSYNRKSRRR